MLRNLNNLVFVLSLVWAWTCSAAVPVVTDDGRYLVLQLGRLGLANRLRTMADMYNMAVISNRWAILVLIEMSMADLSIYLIYLSVYLSIYLIYLSI